MKHSLLLVIFFAMLNNAAAQLNLRGKVTDLNGEPLPGATIFERGTLKNTTTSMEGTYSLQYSHPEAVIVFVYSGFVTQEIVTNGRIEIDVFMEPEILEVSPIVIVGTRRDNRTQTETPVPVDIIDLRQSQLPTAKMDLTSALNVAAPSFNHNKQSGSDGADHIELGTLRGLGPDQTLVLVNGKRRHQTAFVGVFGTRGRGNAGTDLNAISASSIDRIEILRDGAAAQYGSDAIAGVINIITKNTVKKLSGNIGWSGYYDNKYNASLVDDPSQYYHGGKIDGNTFTAALNYGLPLSRNGSFINLSLDYAGVGKTYRQSLDFDEIPYYNYVRRAHGDASYESYGAFLNTELKFGTQFTLYAFGGTNLKSSDAYAFTRDFSARPQRFITGADGQLIDVPDIIRRASDGTIYYNPRILTDVNDHSGCIGVRGVIGKGWNWDVSDNIGYNKFRFSGAGTFNASLGDPRKNYFDDGGFSFLQNTVNVNVAKNIRGIAQGFHLAFGAEHRFENYKLFAGEEASYKTYTPNVYSIGTDSIIDESSGAFIGFDTIYKPGGAQGFPGYQPGDVADATRSVMGGYVDVELDVSEKWLIGGAVRLENYSDFGFTHNYKLTSRYNFAPNFKVRGSIQTGYRAPSLQQLNFSSTFTTVQGGQISEVKIAPNGSRIANAAGIPALKQERSINTSLGFTTRPVEEGITLTVDGYWVKVKDRVVLSGQFDAFDSNLDPALTSELQALQVAYAQFFANAVSTTNRGVDIVLDLHQKFGRNQHFKALLVINFQEMTIDEVNVPERLNKSPYFLSDREEKFILASAPNTKRSLNLEYGIGKFALGTRFTYFGKVELLGYGEDGLGINPVVPSDADENIKIPDAYLYNPKLVNDWYFSAKVLHGATFYAGVDNIFNIHPDLAVVPEAKGWAFNNETGGPWDAVQMGSNGRRLFARLAFNF